MDLLIVTAVFVATEVLAHLLGSAFAGTYALFISLAACSWRLAVARSSWRDIGLRLPSSWLRTMLWALALLAASQLIELLVIGPVARAAHWPAPDLSRFAGLRGNWRALLGWLLLAWTSAAIAEELVFRGFLTSRLLLLFGSNAAGATLAVIVQAACFGAAHFPLGPHGVAIAMAVGLVYGAAYVAGGRNLPALILAHGATDTLSLITIYAGATGG